MTHHWPGWPRLKTEQCLGYRYMNWVEILIGKIIQFIYWLCIALWTSRYLKQCRLNQTHIGGFVQDYSVSYTWVYETSAGCLEIDFSQPRYDTAFWWRHIEPVTSQLTNPEKWPNHSLELIGIYVHTKNPWHKDVVDRQMYDCVR